MITKMTRAFVARPLGWSFFSDPGRRREISKTFGVERFTNAWAKCYEILVELQVLQHLQSQNLPLVLFDNTAFPGAFNHCVGISVGFHRRVLLFKQKHCPTRTTCEIYILRDGQ